jgi:hypothetical protein
LRKWCDRKSVFDIGKCYSKAAFDQLNSSLDKVIWSIKVTLALERIVGLVAPTRNEATDTSRRSATRKCGDERTKTFRTEKNGLGSDLIGAEKAPA